MKTPQRILAVDDEIFNLDILEATLGEDGFEVVRAKDGKVALQRLRENPRFDAIILDRMMPEMDGMEVLKILKATPEFRHIPVIMQTADGQSQQMREGIQAGAYYYLIKPYNEDVLMSIVKAAIRDTQNSQKMREEIRKTKSVVGLLEQARFRFRKPDEAKNIAYYVANFCPDAEKVVYGLNELMINAIEHGNLHLPYETKYELMLQNRWLEELERLCELPENAGKYATLELEANDNEITVTIADQGEGFNWKNYVDFDPVRMTEPIGRGIAMSKAVCFPSLEYKAGGTKAVCHISLH